jgi:hypothetical protein
VLMQSGKAHNGTRSHSASSFAGGVIRMDTYTDRQTGSSSELDREQAPNARRFARFAAAMNAAPPPMAQMLNGPAQTTVARRRAMRNRSIPAIAWLGIGCWTMICGVLFLSLLLWRDQDGRPDQINERAAVSDLRDSENRRQGDLRPGLPELLLTKEEAASGSRPDPPPRPDE